MCAYKMGRISYRRSKSWRKILSMVLNVMRFLLKEFASGSGFSDELAMYT